MKITITFDFFNAPDYMRTTEEVVKYLDSLAMRIQQQGIPSSASGDIINPYNGDAIGVFEVTAVPSTKKSVTEKAVCN